MTTLSELLSRTTIVLESYGVPEPRLETELMLMEVLGVSRPLLYIDDTIQIQSNTISRLETMINRRKTREPLAYILGYTEFYGIELEIHRGVLVPRQETEILVDLALRHVNKNMDNHIVIAEPGTGSGAISIALAKHLPKASIHATDVSPIAVNNARINMDRHSFANNINLYSGNLLAPVPVFADLIVANLPYIPTQQIDHLQPEIKWESMSAIDGGSDGLRVINQLLVQSKDKVNPNGTIILEIDPNQIDDLESITNTLFSDPITEISQDLSKSNRFFTITLSSQ